MTGFDLDFRRRSAGAPVVSRDVQPYQTNWLQDLTYYLGKPEEWLSKAIGNVLSSDPKYDWGNSSHYWNQNTFASLLRDAGLDDVLSDSQNGVLSGILGTALAILNPLDPINKLQIGKLTRTGRAAEAVQVAKSANRLV